MKYSYLLYTWLMGWLLMASCQNEDLTEDVGYLCMDIETVTLLNPQTKAPANYNPKQLAVRIKNEKGEIQAETTDHTQWNKPMALKVGTYTVEAASNGFDGQEAGFDLPYYTGSTEVLVEAGKQKTAALTCRLANVKVTVNYSEEFARYFKVATTTVTAQQKANSTLDFVMGSAQLAGYFPVDDLNVTVKVTNQAGNQFSKTQEIKGVKARDHYIIQYRIAETGNGDIAVEIDPKENKYTFTFDVSTRPKTSLSVETVDAWGTLAYAYGKVATATSGQTFDDSKFGFEYKAASAQEWQTTGVRKEGSHYKAVIKGLQPKTAYQGRFVYKNGTEAFSSQETTFNTEDTPALPNGNLDDWFQNGKTWYACSQAFFSENGASWWDSSNPGTTTGMGALVNKNPTQGNAANVHTPGGKSAELKSQYASAFGIGKFAAASLYAGKFNSLVGANGAKIDFGQPFTARPSALKGWFRYTAGKIDYVGENTPKEANIIKGETDDLCSIFIALTTQSFQVDNTQLATFVDWQNNPAVIAYGELPAAEAVTTANWKEFNVQLKYRDLKKKPTHLVIVCSASKYGDYFTGSTGSLMYVDDLELVYDEPISQ